MSCGREASSALHNSDTCSAYTPERELGGAGRPRKMRSLGSKGPPAMTEYAQRRKAMDEASFLLEDNVLLRLQKNPLQGLLSKLDLLSSPALKNTLPPFFLPY